MCTRYIYSSLYAHTLQIQSQIDVYLYIYICMFVYFCVCIYICVYVLNINIYIYIYSVFPHFEPVDLFTVTCFKLLYLINHTYICTGFD